VGAEQLGMALLRASGRWRTVDQGLNAETSPMYANEPDLPSDTPHIVVLTSSAEKVDSYWGGLGGLYAAEEALDSGTISGGDGSVQIIGQDTPVDAANEPSPDPDGTGMYAGMCQFCGHPVFGDTVQMVDSQPFHSHCWEIVNDQQI
jgi:hypothetical protein